MAVEGVVDFAVEILPVLVNASVADQVVSGPWSSGRSDTGHFCDPFNDFLVC